MNPQQGCPAYSLVAYIQIQTNGEANAVCTNCTRAEGGHYSGCYQRGATFSAVGVQWHSCKLRVVQVPGR